MLNKYIVLSVACVFVCPTVSQVNPSSFLSASAPRTGIYATSDQARRVSVLIHQPLRLLHLHLNPEQIFLTSDAEWRILGFPRLPYTSIRYPGRGIPQQKWCLSVWVRYFTAQLSSAGICCAIKLFRLTFILLGNRLMWNTKWRLHFEPATCEYVFKPNSVLIPIKGQRRHVLRHASVGRTVYTSQISQRE